MVRFAALLLLAVSDGLFRSEIIAGNPSSQKYLNTFPEYKSDETQRVAHEDLPRYRLLPEPAQTCLVYNPTLVLHSQIGHHARLALPSALACRQVVQLISTRVIHHTVWRHEHVDWATTKASILRG